MSAVSIEALLSPYRLRIESYLERVLPTEDDIPQKLHKAMRYASVNSGKRIRACLVYITGEMFNAELDALDAAAAAVELIHAYSLVHDDLPCMDDDDLRRGKPSCHKAFDEATAMLVGDALQSLAFELLGSLGGETGSQLTLTLARAAGTYGMAGGQALDLEASGRNLELDELKQIHSMKTGALITAAVLMGAHVANITDPASLASLSSYSGALGLGFQIHDDILDVISNTETLGKIAGADAERNKATYPGILGLENAKQAARDTYETAIQALKPFPQNTEKLEVLADYAINRIY